MNARTEQRKQAKEESVMTEGVARAMVTDLGQQAARIGAAGAEAVQEAIEDGKIAAKRAIKRGYNRAEDLVDEATYRVKRSPLQSVALGFCTGFLAGAVLIRLLRH